MEYTIFNPYDRKRREKKINVILKTLRIEPAISRNNLIKKTLL